MIGENPKVSRPSLQSAVCDFRVAKLVRVSSPEGLTTFATASNSTQDLVNDVTLHVREPSFDAVVLEGQPLVIQT